MLSYRQRRNRGRFHAALAVSAVALLALGAASVGNTAPGPDDKDQATPATPIKHVIVMIGENRSFDHVFGTYQPKHGEKISNLLSKGIVRPDGTPGRNFADAAQKTVAPQSTFFIGAATGKTPYQILPPPDTNGAPQAQSPTSPPFTSVATVAAIEPALEPQDQVKLTTGATGLPPKALDTRVPNATTLPNGPFQLSGPNLDDDDYTGDTTHRFYQNWQQFDCTVLNASKDDPSGCLKDLFPFVITTFSTNDNGVGNSMAFFNVNDQDATFLRALADQYTMSDNFHQSFMGGTAANHVMLGHADDIFWSDGKGHPVPPPANVAIANPNP
jgi:phospholipase C